MVSFSGQNLLYKSPPGVTKSLSHAQIVSSKGQIQNFRLASPSVPYGSRPPGCSANLYQFIISSFYNWSIPLCTSHSRKNVILSFYCIPKDKSLRKEYTRLIRNTTLKLQSSYKGTVEFAPHILMEVNIRRNIAITVYLSME